MVFTRGVQVMWGGACGIGVPWDRGWWVLDAGCWVVQGNAAVSFVGGFVSV